MSGGVEHNGEDEVQHGEDKVQHGKMGLRAVK